jgi:hypothetical protein
VDIAMTFEKEEIQVPVLSHQASSLHEEEKTISFLIKQKSTSSDAAPTTPSKNEGK